MPHSLASTFNRCPDPAKLDIPAIAADAPVQTSADALSITPPELTQDHPASAAQRRNLAAFQHWKNKGYNR